MKTKSVLHNYLEKNKKVFSIIIIFFLIGMVLGIFLINHTNEQEISNINSYVNSLMKNIEHLDNINSIELLLQSIKQNAVFILIIWVLGCTIIGNSLVYLGLIYKGFSLGYTISAIIATLGAQKGSIFVFASLLLQNIIFLPAVFILAESGIKLYTRITKQCVNLKQELLRHTIIMLIALAMTILSGIVEVYLSTNLLIIFKNFI